MAVLLCLAVPSAGFAQEESDIKILCLGKYLEPDVAPFYADSRIMVPVRAVFEAVGAEVVWDDALKKATGTKGADVVSLTLNSNVITVNGDDLVMDTVLVEKESRVFAPVRFVAESFGYKVSYHDQSSTAVISADEEYDFYSSVLAALPTFDSVTGAELIREEKNNSGHSVFYYSYNEDYTTDYFNALQADFGYVLSNIYFENGAHVYEYASANNHMVTVADYYSSDGIICITVIPCSQKEFDANAGNADVGQSVPSAPVPEGGSLPNPDPDIPEGVNPLDYSSVTGARLVETVTADDGSVIYRYEYNQFAHMAYGSFLSAQGWYFYDFDFDLDTFSETTSYTNGTDVIEIALVYMLGEVWIKYP